MPSVPYYTIKLWWSQRPEPLVDEEGFSRLTFNNCFSISIGMAQSKMNYLYTMEEVFGRIFTDPEDGEPGSE